MASGNLVDPMKFLIFSSADGYQRIGDIVPGTAITGTINARSLIAIFNVSGFNGKVSGSHASLQNFVMGIKDGVMTYLQSITTASFSNFDISAYDYLVFNVASGSGVGNYSFTFTQT